MSTKEIIYYNMADDRAYRGDGSALANDNVPLFRMRDLRDVEWRLLASDSRDANGVFDDPYTALVGETVTASMAIDNNAIHYADGKVETAITDGVAIGTIKLEALTQTPRIAGTIKLTNSTAETENINYNGYTVTGGVYTFTLADGSFVVGNQTPTYAYAKGDAARVLEMPIVKDATVDVTGKDTGVFLGEMDCNNVIFLDLIKNQSEIASCLVELQVYNNSARRLFALSVRVRCLYVLDDDGAVGPAPSRDFYNATEIDGFNFLENPMTTKGDMIFATNATGAPGRLALGGVGQVLRRGTATAPAWFDVGNLAANTATASRDLATGDIRVGLLDIDNASGATITIRPNSAVAYPANGNLCVYNVKAANSKLQAATGVNIGGETAGSITIGGNEMVFLRRLAQDVWVVPGYDAEAAP